MPLVLVSGATGYIAAHVCNEAMQRGHNVRGTVRDAKKGEELKATLEKLGGKGKFEYVVIPDMQKEGCYDEAIKGVDVFAHVASPFFTEDVTDAMTQLINPALTGTRNALLAASSEPKCKRIIVTSSFAAIMSAKPDGYTFSEKDWNTESRATGGNGQESYRASKALAEKSAWDYKEKEKPHFDVVTMCPPLVVGEAIHPVTISSLNTSLKGIWRFMSGQTKEVLPGGLGFIAVQDLAKAHVLACEKPEAGGHRFLVAEGWHSWHEEADTLRKLFPAVAHNIPTKEGAYPKTYTLDNSQTKKVLGLEFQSLETMLKGSGEFLMKLAEKEGVDVAGKA